MSEAIAMTGTPAVFPSDRYPDTIHWCKGEGWTGEMSNDVFRELYARRCVEVDNLPDCNLQNPIHPIFAQSQFTDLSIDDYKFLVPAMKLASRFIIDDTYLEFFEQLRYGSVSTRKSSGTSKEEQEYLAPDTEYLDDSTVQRNALKQSLSDLANSVKFFTKDEAWSHSDDAVAEAFSDSRDRACKYHRLHHANQGCGSCMYCTQQIVGVCPICQNRDYKDKDAHFTRVDLAQVCKARGLKRYHHLSKGEMIKLIDEDNDSKNMPPPCESKHIYQPTKEQLSQITVGMHHDMTKHVREAATAGWSVAEERRFQFSVAATLVHELVHVLWYTRRCWRCFDTEPWFSDAEINNSFGTMPELGNSWELWAFGNRVPQGGRVLLEEGIEPNFFQCCQWSFVWSTEAGGTSRDRMFEYDYVLTVDYINAWFREETWERIQRLGRKEGRPSHDDVVIMREEPVAVVSAEAPKSEGYGLKKCTLTNFSHPQLVAEGGFEKADNRRLFGDDFDTDRKANQRIKILRRISKISKRTKATKTLQGTADCVAANVDTGKRARNITELDTDKDMRTNKRRRDCIDQDPNQRLSTQAGLV
jgi:hypothetical protein